MKGTLRLAGKPVRLADIRLPILNVAAAADAIAPRATTSAVLAHVSSSDREQLVIEGGHVGIVVGRTAKKELWPKVLDSLDRHDRA